MPQVPYTFQTFISHPFNDYRTGHNALEERVSLSLKTLCAQPAKHFQNIDLCLGVGEESSPDRKIMNIYLREKNPLLKDQPTIKNLYLCGIPLRLMSLSDTYPGGLIERVCFANQVVSRIEVI